MVKAARRIENVSSYYFADKLAEIRAMNAQGLDIINLGIGSPDLPPPPEVISALGDFIQQPDSHGYQSYTGIPELRNAFCEWYNTHFKVGLNDQNEILPLIGSKEGIMHISMAFLDEGDQVLVPDPGYPAYETITKMTGAETIKYTLSEENNYQVDLNELSKLDFSKIKLMWLNYPHMPTGTRPDKEIIKGLIELAEAKNFLLCNDNPYALILNDEPISLFNIDTDKSHSLELCSVSKHYNMPGWRVGAVLGNADNINTILRFKSNMDSGMFKPIQLAASLALQKNGQWFNKLNEEYLNRKQLIHQLLDLFDCSYEKDQAGLFVWAKVKSGQSGKELSDKMLYEHKVFVTPGFIFGKQGEKFIRVSACQDRSKIKTAIERCA